MKMENYKVCILAAGIGSRMGAISEHISKAILPVNFKAVISYILEKFSKDIEIVIAVGHKKETVIDYISLAHPDRKIEYVKIDNYFGPGTGPGHSLLQCKNHLQCPFIFFVSDTLTLEEIPKPDHNWYGIAPVKETEQYCTVKIKNNLIYEIDDKIKTNNKFAFMGVAGIKDYDVFFEALEKNREVISGEIQVSNGFKKLIEKKLVPLGFTWFDTGSLNNYIETNKNFSGDKKKFDFSKGNEFIYFVDGKVIKFFADESIVKKRCERAQGPLKNLCPEILSIKGNFYAYKKIDGQVLYNVLNTQIVNDFFQWIKLNLWEEKKLLDGERKRFDEGCYKFYHDKTIERLEMFYNKTNIDDIKNNINGVPIPPLKDLLEEVKWDYVCSGVPSNFHGDLQFDNVLVTRDSVSSLQKFILLDWRQDFGGLTEIGDLYYDLAKLYGGLILSYPLIKEGMFSFDMSGSSIYYNFFVKNDLLEAKEEYEKFLRKNNFDLKKIRIITSLIFLNMSPLHNDPFDLMLHYLGKSMLHKSLQDLGGNNKVGDKNVTI